VLHVAHGRTETKREADLGAQTPGVGEVSRPPGVAEVVGHWLLAEDVLAGSSALHVSVKWVWTRRAHVDDLDVVAQDDSRWSAVATGMPKSRAAACAR